MREPRPQLIAHRGASRERPENTLPAFLRALELGAEGIELDVHATRDGVVVVHHDFVPAAETSDPELRDRPIAELDFAQLGTFRVAGDTPIPTLAQVLDAVADRVDVYVELKGRGIERDVADVILTSPSRSRCAVHAFDHRAIRRLSNLAPEIRRGALLASYLIDSVEAVRAAGATDLWQATHLIDGELVDSAHSAGVRVIAWTVNEADEAARLAALGVDGICSDLLPVVAPAVMRGHA